MSKTDEEVLKRCHRKALELVAYSPLILPRLKRSIKPGQLQTPHFGNSLEFAQHREYLPGDDIRKIDWKAFARTEELSVKMHHDETEPVVDIVLDCSSSMLAPHAKGQFTYTLLYFLIESCLLQRGRIKLLRWTTQTIREVPLEQLMKYNIDFQSETPQTATPESLPMLDLRQGALTFVISDLLFDWDPQLLFSALTGCQQPAFILAPFTKDELTPAWEGFCELEDVESSDSLKVRFDKGTLKKYQEAYARHFQLWLESAVRSGNTIVRLPASAETLDLANIIINS